MKDSFLHKLTDAELFTHFSTGDEEAFREVVNRYKNSLFAFLKRFLIRHDMVEDVFQETLLQLYASRDSFDSSKPLRPWLFTIAANKARDALRKHQRSSAMSLGAVSDSADITIDDVLNTFVSSDTTPIDEIEKDETARRVRQIIAIMPENLREILLLSYFEKFSYKQMAEILGIPIGTVKSRLHMAVVYFTRKWKDVEKKETLQ
ncbi:MAG: sigma-70 family RNA polymerase sigma factor [Planctomycetota bacterium]